jgi:hypothetical protein
MRRYMFVLLFVGMIAKSMAFGAADAIAASAIANEPLLATTVSLGNDIYVTCILTPPVSATQQAACAAKYVTYLANIQILHIDMFGGVNTKMLPGMPDPYFWSAYDVCRFDMGNLILFNICV